MLLHSHCRVIVGGKQTKPNPRKQAELVVSVLEHAAVASTGTGRCFHREHSDLLSSVPIEMLLHFEEQRLYVFRVVVCHLHVEIIRIKQKVR